MMLKAIGNVEDVMEGKPGADKPPAGRMLDSRRNGYVNNRRDWIRDGY